MVKMLLQFEGDRSTGFMFSWDDFVGWSVLLYTPQFHYFYHDFFPTPP